MHLRPWGRERRCVSPLYVSLRITLVQWEHVYISLSGRPTTFRSPGTILLHPDIPPAEDDSYISLLVSSLRACNTLRCLDTGRRIHSDATTTLSCNNGDANAISRTLVHMYIRCGSLPDARNAFESIKVPSLACWTALMSAYTSTGEPAEALRLFHRLESERYVPDDRTFVAALMACSSLAVKEVGKLVDGKVVKLESLETGMAIHSKLVSSGCEWDMFVTSSLVGMYAKCGSMTDAREVFERVSKPVLDVVPWNSLIQGYADNGEDEEALECFELMQRQGCQPSSRTFVAAAVACGNLAGKEEMTQVDGKAVKVRSLERGLKLYGEAERHGIDLFLASSLVNMFARCGSMESARKVFDHCPSKDVVMWNSLMMGYAENDEAELALETFARTHTEGGCLPIPRSFVAAFMACSVLAGKEVGRVVDGNKVVKVESLERTVSLHTQASRAGCEMEVYVASTLVDAYAKCGSVAHARQVFDKMPAHALVTLNSLMLGYAENGSPEIALDVFDTMLRRGCVPDGRTYLAALMACVGLADKEEATTLEQDQNVKQHQHLEIKLKSLEKAMEIHAHARAGGYDTSDVFVSSVLLELYITCGSLVDARAVFDRSKLHNVVLWTALIMGYAEKTEGKVALELFQAGTAMQPDLNVNCRAHVAVLVACGSLVGLETGKSVHSEICRKGLETDQFVANSLVDLYCKCGSLVNAEAVFNSMPVRNVVSWSSLVAGYSGEGDVQGVFAKLAEMEEQGVKPNAITCLSVLAVCSHAGLVDRGKEFFERMTDEYRVLPGREHVHCMVDLFGRANRLPEAVEMITRVPEGRMSRLAWKTLLSACSKWNNVETGKLAFERLVAIDDKEASAYVLMSNIYKSIPS